MNFLQLRYFKTVADMKHITKAASSLYISQPALSKSIRLLEEEVGFPLFSREGSGISLNENGRILYHHASSILSSLDYALSEIKDLNNENHSVTLSMVAGTKFLPELIMGIREYYPDIDLAIKQEQFEGEKKDHSCDLFIYSSLDPAVAENDIILLSEECYLGVSVDNPLSSQSIIAPSMLKKETFFTMLDSQPLYKLTNALCEAGGFVPKNSLQFDNRETIYDLINANMGVSLIPQKTWAPYMKQKKIKLLPLSVSCKRYLVLSWPRDRYLTKDMKSLIQYFTEYFQSIS